MLAATLTALALLPLAAARAQDGPAFGIDVRLGAGEDLLAYAWDGAWMVPSAVRGPSVRIEHGERGLRPGARLYLTGHSPVEVRATDARVVDEHALELVDGRFGEALGFGPRSRLRVALDRPGDDAGWTLSFWLRPGPLAAGRTLIRASGAIEIALDGQLRVRAALLPSGTTLRHPVPLTEGEWSHVAVVHDPAFLGQLRVFAGSSAVGAALPPGEPSRNAVELFAGDLAHDGTGFTGALDDLSLESLPVSTEESLRAASPAPSPGPHELRLLTTRGERTYEPAAGASRDLELDRAEELARGGLVHAVVEDGALRWAPAHWIELETGPAPPPRTTHPLVSLPDRRVFTFAGETRDSHLWPYKNTADAWILDAATNRWTRAVGPGPSPRCHMPAAYSPDHDVVLLVGGVRLDVKPPDPNGDTWLFHPDTECWEQRFPSGDRIGSASDHGLVYLPALRRFLLLRQGRNMLYDPAADTWELMPPATAVTASGKPTEYRFGGSTMCALDEESGDVVTFGGSYGPEQDVYSDTTALYDVAANRYTVLDPPVRPPPRVRGAYGYDPRRRLIVLFGGVRDQFSERHDDLWVFDLGTRLWSELRCSNRPPRCGGYYGIGRDEVADRFVVFSGRSAPDRWLSRTWALEIRQERGTARYAFDRIEQPASTRWVADVVTPGDSRVDFAVRTSDDGAQWSRWRRTDAPLPDQRFAEVAVVLSPGSNGEVPSVTRLGWR